MTLPEPAVSQPPHRGTRWGTSTRASLNDHIEPPSAEDNTKVAGAVARIAKNQAVPAAETADLLLMLGLDAAPGVHRTLARHGHLDAVSEAA